MKPRSAFWVILVAVLMIGGRGLHADITPVNNPSVLQSGDSITGPITNIDPVNQFVQVRDDNGMIQTIRLDESIIIMRNGEPTNLNSLIVGDHVTLVRK